MFGLFFQSIMRFLDDQPEQQVKPQAGHAAREEDDQESQPEPEDADPEELG
jgi:hypothetical protein